MKKDLIYKFVTDFEKFIFNVKFQIVSFYYSILLKQKK